MKCLNWIFPDFVPVTRSGPDQEQYIVDLVWIGPGETNHLLYSVTERMRVSFSTAYKTAKQARHFKQINILMKKSVNQKINHQPSGVFDRPFHWQTDQLCTGQEHITQLTLSDLWNVRPPRHVAATGLALRRTLYDVTIREASPHTGPELTFSTDVIRGGRNWTSQTDAEQGPGSFLEHVLWLNMTDSFLYWNKFVSI